MDFDGDLVDRGSGHHMQLGVIHEPLHRGLELRVRSRLGERLPALPFRHVDEA